MTPIHQSSTPSVLLEKQLLEQNHKVCNLTVQYHSCNMDKSKSIWVLVTEALLNLKYNQRNKLFERTWPLRLVTPLSTQAQLKSMCVFGAKTWLG